MSQDRMAVVPTRLVLQSLKQKLGAATRGHSLLKKKADALQLRFRAILRKIADHKEAMGKYMRDASLSFAAARFAAGENLPHLVIENVDQPTFKLKMGTENVVGVHLPIFEPWASTAQSKEYTGLGQGGQKVKTCRETYFKALESLVEIASLQTTFITLDQVIKITNRRVNAIEYVVKPRLVNTIAAVEVELEELEREEMFRLKKIQQKKEREQKKADAEAAKAEKIAQAAKLDLGEGLALEDVVF